jgi:transcriptional regulator with GAF, ATPase, and Fis domain
VASQSVGGQQHEVRQQDESADTNAKPAVEPKCVPHVTRQNYEKYQGQIEKIPVDVLQDQGKRSFADLYYRLNVFPIRIPPLRERPEDIPLLVRYFTQKYGQRMQRQIESIPTVAMRKLSSWHWPGNVRELENFIERSVILTHGTALQAPISELSSNGSPHLESNLPISSLAELERDHILRALQARNWVVGGRKGAAELLGMKRTSLMYRMRKLRISRPTSNFVRI